jgi:penicillin-insensitive murein endopeptidase
MRPHRSHQSGRDVDLGYYYIASRYIGWYQPANSYSLDCERSWAFIKALVTQTDVEYIFMDARVQRLLKHYAMDAGEDKGWLDTIFQSGSPHPSPIIRHANGHRTHMHVRFHNPRAQQVGFLAHHSLMKKRVLKGRLLRVAPSPEPIVPERRLPTKPDASSGRAVVAHTQE